MDDLRIGELAARTGTPVPTIRYYEEVGLLPRATRRPGGQRTYAAADVDRLTFIRRCRDFDFSIAQVRVLVGVVDDRASSCLTARDLAATHLTAVRAKMRELRALERSLVRFVDDCTRTCAGGPGPDCVVLEDLSRGSRRRS